MPILKNKVALSSKRFLDQRKEQKRKEREQILQTLHEINQTKEPRPKRTSQLNRSQDSNYVSVISPKSSSSSNNIMKNYSRALVMFALSDMATPSIKPLLEEHNLDLENFRRFVNERRAGVNCIKGLREMLLVTETDNSQVACFKQMFQKSSIVFLKCFSVNWIFNGKISDKMTHMKYRFKILRRVKNPAYFTYLEDYGK